MFYRIKRLFRRLEISLHTEYLYEHNLAHIPEVKRPENVLVEHLRQEDVKDLLGVWDIDLADMQRRLKDGHLCFIPRLHGEIAGYFWLQLSGIHPIHPAGLNMMLKPDTCMIYHVRVSDKFQSFGIGAFVYSDILHYAKTHHQSNVLIYTASTNIANQKSLAKVGFVLTRKYLALKCNGRFYRMLTRDIK